MNKLLEIIGPYPPPLGGISIHISRMTFFLKKENINFRVLNHGYFSSENVIATNKSVFWYIQYLFRHKAALIHFHQFFRFHYLYYYLFSKINSTPVFITLHGEDIIYSASLIKKACIWLLQNTRATVLICVSKNLSELLSKNGIKNQFLPASVPAREIHPVKLSPIQGKEYFLYSIWKLEKKISGSVYNVELAMELLSRIKNRFHMLFLIGTEAESDKDYLSLLLNKYSITDSVTVVYEGNLVNYLNNCKFLLRTNNIDGYGISIQEALDLKIPAIASDTCVRPKGTILFKTNDINDLHEKVNNIETFWNESKIESPGYHLQLIELYKDYLHKN